MAMHAWGRRALSDVLCFALAFVSACSLGPDFAPTVPSPGRCATAVAAGTHHSCAIRTDGTVWCWGANELGQLGNNTAIDSSIPVQVAMTAKAIAIAVGQTHSCALDSAGQVACWGGDPVGQLGDGRMVSNSAVPVGVVGLSGRAAETATAIAAGDSHSCALLANRTVACWGADDERQVGDQGSPSQLVPVGVPGLSGVMAIAAGGEQTCAVDGSAALSCWGNNSGPTHVAITDPPGAAGGRSVGVTSVAVGAAAACALGTDGTVWCFGDNDAGELGSPLASGSSSAPFQAELPVHAMAVAAGGKVACAVDDQRQLWCWGADGDFELASASAPDTVTIPLRTSYTDVAAVAVGGSAAGCAVAAGGSTMGCSHVCALGRDGGISCSGFNGRGELGNGTRTTQPAPQPVPGLTNVTSLAAGGAHTCAALADQTVVCWGNNDSGQLGDGTRISHATPVPVLGVHGATQVAVGSAHSCALLADQTVECWGDNEFRQLGDGSTDTPGVARPVRDAAGQSLSGVTQLVAGAFHTCAISGGNILCWGRDVNGELGAPGGNSPSPQQVVLPQSGFLAVGLAAGGVFTCAVGSDHSAWCWGNANDGELGNPVRGDNQSPVQVGLSNIDQISAGADFACAHTSDGGVACWGNGGNGQLGDGKANGTSAPVSAIPSTPGAARVVAGGGHACALTATTGAGGAITCWGSAFFGQVGNGGYADLLPPVTLSVSNVIDLAAGDAHTCALLSDHSVRCWGDDRQGQLGDGASADQSPVAPLLTCPAR